MIVIENSGISSEGCPWSLYRVYVSFIHQIISQRPSLFRPVHNLVIQTLRQEAWTTEILKILLSSIFLHSQDVEFLVLIQDLEAWPSAVQDWWSQMHTLFPESRGSRCTFVISCLELNSDMTRGRTLHLDLNDYYSQTRAALIGLKLRHLEQSYRTDSLAESLENDVNDSIVSAANAFEGSFTATSSLLEHIYHTFTLSSRSAITLNIENCPKTPGPPEEMLYREHIQNLAAKPPMVRSWTTITLSWILLAVRPLHVEELAVAVAINMSQSNIDEIYTTKPMDIEWDLKNHLGSLIAVENRRVHIVSSLAKRVLTEEYMKDDFTHLETDYNLTLLCLHYLTMIFTDGRSVLWGKCLSSVSFKHQLREPRNPTLEFLYYACQFWPTHFLRDGDPDQYLKKSVADFLKQPMATKWFKLHLYSNGSSSNPLVESLHEPIERVKPNVAKSNTLDESNQVSTEGAKPVAVDEVSPPSATATDLQDLEPAVTMACYIGLTSIVPDLLHDSKLACEPKVVHMKRGHSERDVGILNMASRFYVACAMSNGDDSTVKQLLENSPERISGYSPLHMAVLSGSLKLVKALCELLAHPIEANAQG